MKVVQITVMCGLLASSSVALAGPSSTKPSKTSTNHSSSVAKTSAKTKSTSGAVGESVGKYRLNAKAFDILSAKSPRAPLSKGKTWLYEGENDAHPAKDIIGVQTDAELAVPADGIWDEPAFKCSSTAIKTKITEARSLALKRLQKAALAAKSEMKAEKFRDYLLAIFATEDHIDLFKADDLAAYRISFHKVYKLIEKQLTAAKIRCVTSTADLSLRCLCKNANDVSTCSAQAVVSPQIPGAIHLCPRGFNDPKTKLVDTLIHEAAHMAGIRNIKNAALGESERYNCKKFDCTGSCYAPNPVPSDEKYKEYGTSYAGESINNAESWTHLAQCLVSGPRK